MVKSITFCALLLIFSNTIQLKRGEAVQNIVSRNVLVETGISRSSGVVLSTGIVLSTFHSLDVGYGVTVNGKEAKIVLVRPDLDLMILLVETEEMEQVQFADVAEIGTEVITVGNPAMKTGVVSFGRIVYADESTLITDTLAMHGFSGGGVYTTDGVLIGIIQRMFGSKNGGSWVTSSIRSALIVKALEGQ